MDVMEKTKGFFKKLEPWQIMAGVIVTGFGLYTLVTKKDTVEYEAPQTALNSGGLFAAGGDTSGAAGFDALNENLINILEDQGTAFTAAFNNVSGSITDSNNILSGSIMKVNDGLVQMQTALADGIKVTSEKVNLENTGTIIPGLSLIHI